MQKSEQLKTIVKEAYGNIAKQANQGCGCSCKCNDAVSIYDGQQGYFGDADLGLGCGIPTKFAQIKEGQTVLDLGSGAGIDVFVAGSMVGDSGKVIGLDMTEEMVETAKKNQEKLGITNVEFRFGDIENMPVAENEIDVIISNCVLNLVPDKTKAFSEMYRILKPGGHFCVSDIVLNGELPPKLKSAAELYAGCVAGASQKQEYLDLLKATGFTEIEVKEDKQFVLDEFVIEKYLTSTELETYKKSKANISSITVLGKKPF
jgi:ubiquinone/menaquinone biosynthesis C-methylase UbiE